MKKKNKLFGKINIILFLGFLLLDQISKYLVVVLKPNIDFKIFAFTFVKNTGAIWGFFQNSNFIFICISFIAIGALLYFYEELPVKSYPFFALLLAGIFGNLIDRIIRSYVVDFINFKFWPVFNVADSLIVVSVLAIIFYSLKEEYDDKKKSIKK